MEGGLQARQLGSPNAVIRLKTLVTKVLLCKGRNKGTRQISAVRSGRSGYLNHTLSNGSEDEAEDRERLRGTHLQA